MVIPVSQVFRKFEISYFFTKIYAKLLRSIARLSKGLGIYLRAGKDTPKQGQQASQGIGAIKTFFRSYSNSRKPGFSELWNPVFFYET